MPDKDPSSDDSFAELAGRVPDARERRSAPLSRREAREQAARDGASTEPAPAAGDPPRAPVSSPSLATLDDLFEKEQAAPATSERRRGRRAGRFIALGIVVVLLGGLTAGGFWVWNTYEDQIRALMGWEEPRDFEEGIAEGEAVVTIHEGDVPRDISLTLFTAGVTKTPMAFYDHLIETSQNPTFYPGVYRLQARMASPAALAALENPDNRIENGAQLPEGLTVAQSVDLLAEGTGIPLEDYQAAVADPSAYGVTADSLEGWIFPATYTFAPDLTAEDIIRTMVNRTEEALDHAGVPVERRHEILTIASIIQREARFQDDFYRVSRVIQNRLDPSNQETLGLLQMDSTAQYGYDQLHDGTVSSTQAALDDDNPWNTYVYAGLPVGPIANPGDLAIRAALEPAEGPWLYFVTVNLDTGDTLFTTTYAEHLEGVQQWEQWCRDNPDSGC